MPWRRSKFHADYVKPDRRRGPSHARKPMPLKRCEWCRSVIERRPGEKSMLFLKRRFCDTKCMSRARELQKRIIIKTTKKLKKGDANG